ncbi:MAG: hypothetical protein JWO83_1440 [Caulobacteraceae bacterium]|nr:hypothetical protein [Caulobacteraceae bacterium]
MGLQVLGEGPGALLGAVADDEEQDGAGAQTPVDRVRELAPSRSDAAPMSCQIVAAGCFKARR